MKKLILTVAIVISYYAATAQSIEKMLGSALKSASAQTTTTDSSTRIPSAAELSGEWTYEAPILKYAGSDPVTAMAIGGISAEFTEGCSQAGLQPGSGHASFNGGKVAIEIPKHKTSGSYVYTPETGKIELTFSDKEKKGTLHGKTTVDAEGALAIMFELQDTLDAINAITGKGSGDKNMDKIAEILKQCPGIEIGLKLTKK